MFPVLKFLFYTADFVQIVNFNRKNAPATGDISVRYKLAYADIIGSWEFTRRMQTS